MRELYDYLHSAMPLGKGGSLSDQTYQNIVAFLIEANGATAGGQPFTAQGAQETVMTIGKAGILWKLQRAEWTRCREEAGFRGCCRSRFA
jgi:hypothetical protein